MSLVSGVIWVVFVWRTSKKRLRLKSLTSSLMSSSLLLSVNKCASRTSQCGARPRLPWDGYQTRSPLKFLFPLLRYSWGKIYQLLWDYSLLHQCCQLVGAHWSSFPKNLYRAHRFHRVLFAIAIAYEPILLYPIFGTGTCSAYLELGLAIRLATTDSTDRLPRMMDDPTV
jgi:hypothetical protein